MNYYRRYIGDYARDTTSISLTEHGAYAMLLDAYYGDEHPLPADVGLLYRICRATGKPEQAAVRAVAARFFPVYQDGLRHNARADKELGKAKTAIDQMSEAGKRGADKRWGSDAGGDRVPHKKRGKKHGVTHAGGDAGQDAGGHAGEDATTNHQPPASNLQPPTSSPQPPEVRTNKASSSPVAPRTEKPLSSALPRGAETWNAYSKAYVERYKIEPVRNGKTNSQVAQFVDRIGVEEAPRVAEFYLSHNNEVYVKRGHAVGFMLADAEKLRTEWATGHKITGREARSAEQRDAVAEQIRRVSENARHTK